MDLGGVATYLPKQSIPLPQLLKVQIVPPKPKNPHSIFTIAKLLVSLCPTCSKKQKYT